ncbi:MAG: U32 family peptidase [Firmicutes bacterium]|nr:U32 family peptidase [[Eubacterium] siraeum]MCM1487865.1 U32 family peptidase [Bacillota bacterium]
MTNKRLRAEVADRRQLEQALGFGGFQYIYADERLLTADTPQKEKIIAVPPIFLGDCEEYTEKRLNKLKALGFDRALAHTVGHIPLIEASGMKFHGGMRLNIANSASAAFFAEQGMEDMILSCELTASRIKALSCKLPFGVMAYGNLPLMVTRRCPINDGKPCGSAKNCGKALIDRQGRRLKTLCSNTVEILNPDILTIADKTEDFPTVDFFLLKFTCESDIISVTESFLKGKKPQSGFTRGLYYRGVE